MLYGELMRCANTRTFYAPVNSQFLDEAKFGKHNFDKPIIYNSKEHWLYSMLKRYIIKLETKKTNARILKAHSHSHSMSGRSFSLSVTHHSMSLHSH